ncbi:ABC transporter substrate-binding protein [Colwellia sp. RSH04]|uniref:substrate-binding periplasmic protein n=1 Tax=Colwellia sp. RSH04 TaxID=2305464 RepID=UPI000E56B079|nr:transporter substrate-binding domain-containing protein [Colwellia sp. RSH04]RHW75343.1 hypothetical protein D1094_14605 [Colwellia sp. RSH04]
MSKKLLLISLFVFIYLFISKLYAAENIIVGGYIFPPFVEKDNNGKTKGITLDLIKSLNEIQNKYHFSFILTSARRRYLAFEQKQFDALFFENILWGWQNHPVQASKVFLFGGEVFIALKSKAKTQNYFNSLEERSISAMLGYHYKFADLNSEPNYLRSKFNIHLSTDEKMNIQLVLSNRMDIAIVTKSYLDRFLLENPSTKSKLLISRKLDQEYKHTILLRKEVSLDIDEMNSFIDKLVETGKLKTVLNKYGIKS